MDKLKKCAVAFSNLLDIKYHCIIGRKNKKRELIIYFNESHFPHLVGLQKISDVFELRGNRERIFKKIIVGNITYDMIKDSVNFPLIEPRLNNLSHIEEFLDNNSIIFSYEKRKNQTKSNIDSKYLLQSEINGLPNYLFIDEDNLGFFGRTFFPKNEIDFSIGQSKWTLLKKDKIYLSTGKIITQFDRITPKSILDSL